MDAHLQLESPSSSIFQSGFALLRVFFKVSWQKIDNIKNIPIYVLLFKEVN